jgi:predicted metal-binding membrane protein
MVTNTRRWPIAPIMVTLAGMAWLVVLQQANRMAAFCSMCSGMSVACPMCMGMHQTMWVVLPSFLIMWATMMAAMMLPAVTPMAVVYARLAAQHRARGQQAAPVALFVLGYLLAWAGTGLLAFGVTRLVQWVIVAAPDVGTMNQLVAGVVLLGAGLYQLSPYKDRCLSHCRSPLAFFMQNWRRTPAGVFRMGLSHSLYCIGCCWGLMAVMFAVGLMNVAWMVGLTAVMTLEKLVPHGIWVSRISGVALVGTALVFVARHALG